MKMRLFCFLFIVLAFELKMQADTIEVAGSFDMIQCDNVGNIYATKNNTIYKYNEEGKLLYTYNYSKYGQRPGIDVSIPMRAFLYFSDFKKIVILDSRLIEMRIIDLNLFGEVENPTLACFSKDQNIWIYNATKSSLLKLDNSGNRIHESQNLISLLNQNILPSKIREQENNVYVTDTTKGIFVFDILGNYLRTIPLLDVENFQVKEGKLFFFSEGKFQSIDINTFEISFYGLDENNGVLRVLLNNQSLVKLYQDHFVIERKE